MLRSALSLTMHPRFLLVDGHLSIPGLVSLLLPGAARRHQHSTYPRCSSIRVVPAPSSPGLLACCFMSPCAARRFPKSHDMFLQQQFIPYKSSFAMSSYRGAATNASPTQFHLNLRPLQIVSACSIERTMTPFHLLHSGGIVWWLSVHVRSETPHPPRCST